MEDVVLTPEQEAEARQVEDVVVGAMRIEVRRMARLLVSKESRELLGETEFEIRDAMSRSGARLIDAALEERKKRGLEIRASSVRTAASTTRSSSASGPAPSPRCSAR